MLSVVLRAVLAGGGAGVMASLLQFAFVQPVILHAELFEGGELIHYGADGPGLVFFQPLSFDPPRDLVTFGFTTLTYIGWALVLVPLMSIAAAKGTLITARTGLMWGVAGFVAAFLAPAFTAAPGLPGVASAAIEIRQIWWLATVASAATALWLIAFAEHPARLPVAVVLLLVPHLIGLPQPDYFLGPAPPELGALMAARVLGVGLAAWVVMGALAGYLCQRTPRGVLARAM